jgi:hypothetical protein
LANPPLLTTNPEDSLQTAVSRAQIAWHRLAPNHF